MRRIETMKKSLLLVARRIISRYPQNFCGLGRALQIAQCLSLVLTVAGTASADIAFYDGTFNPTDWTTVLEYGNGTVSMIQVVEGGNPGNYLRINHNGFTWELAAYHFRNDAIYDPSIAPIERLVWSLDERAIQNLYGIGVAVVPAVMQDGKLYGSPKSGVRLNNSSSWMTMPGPISGYYTADDFFRYGTTDYLPDGGHPDFSSTGSPLLFGFSTLNNNTDIFASRAAGFDNWSITLITSPVPIPAAAWLLGSGLIGLIGIRKKLKK